VLIGRDTERERVDRLLAGARAGTAGTLAVVGPAGQGKTALLEHALAGATGFRVLPAVGSAAEQTIGLAGLGALLRPLLAAVGELPSRQRRAVEDAFALSDPPSTGPDPLALGSGVLALLTAPAQDSPLLVVVDDVQWWDDESRRVLDFALRRLGADPVAVLLGARSVEELPGSATERLELGSLGAREAERLLLSLHADLAPEVLDALVQHGGGNPLALVEAARGLADGQRQGLSPLHEPLALPSSVREAYAGRLDALPPATRHLLLVAACDGRGDVAVLEAAGADLAAASSAVHAGLVALVGGQLRFRHPLVAAAVLEAATADARAAAHRALAAAFEGGDRERAVWHRAAAAVPPDFETARELSELAAAARAAGSWESAARAEERAGELAAGGPDGHLVRAAEAWLQAGQGDRAVRLLAQCEQSAGLSSADLAAAQRARATLAELSGSWARASRLRLAAAAELAGDARTGTLLEALRDTLNSEDAGTVEPVVAALTADRPSERLAAGVAAALRATRLLVAVDRSDLGRAPAVSEAMQHAVGRVDPTLPAAVLDVYVSLAMGSGQLAAGRVLARRVAASARATGDVPALARALATTAFCDHSLGRWNVACSSATEVRMLVTGTSAPAVLARVLHLVADIDAARGRAEACQAACAELRALGDLADDPRLHGLADRREGTLHLATGDAEGAVPWLESAQRCLQLAGESHPYYSPAPELVEAYLRLGRVEDARESAAAFAAHVGPGAPPTAQARVLRLEGLLADGSSYDTAFEQSEQLDAGTGLTYLLARTLLLHGERLRRDRRRSDARSRLTRAAGIFRSLEATPWAERAEAELAACGARVARPTATAPSAVLTPQELQIALLVKQGMRNRDIAATLFLSLRTVEAHLSSSYRKLGASGRTQLAALLVD
jgi:DNA-binding CsgD family transcriptional regulator